MLVLLSKIQGLKSVYMICNVVFFFLFSIQFLFLFSCSSNLMCFFSVAFVVFFGFDICVVVECEDGINKINLGFQMFLIQFLKV